MMNKSFLFINLSIECGWNTGVNHGIAFLVPVARKHGYEVSCLNLQDEMPADVLRRKIQKLSPSVIGFSCTSHQLRYLKRYSAEIAEYSQALQISGGVGSTLEPEWILSETSISGACIGEGDVPLDSLLSRIDSGDSADGTEGFWWRTADGIQKCDVPGFQADISKLDFPDYTIFERETISRDGGLLVMLSRGCPYNCHYCCNNALRDVYACTTGYFRMPPVEYAIQLLEKLVESFPETRFIDFEDDLLIGNKKWFRAFAREYDERIGLPYRACVRVECVTEEMVTLMKESGCQRAYIGVESGSERLRSEVLNRKHSNEMIVEKCRLIKQAGLELLTFNMIGLPFETANEMGETLALNKRIAPDNGQCTFFYPYRGTHLYRVCEDQGLLVDEEQMLEITNYNTRPAIRMTKDLEHDCMRFQRRIQDYLSRRHMMSSLRDRLAGLPVWKRIVYHIYYLVAPVVWRNPWLARMSWPIRKLLGGRIHS